METNLAETSSGSFVHGESDIEAIAERISAAVQEDAEIVPEDAGETSEAFKELASPKLPGLERANRARLQIQTPNRVYFYWSLKNDPYQILHRAFGTNTGSYTLVAKLLNKTLGTEQVYAVDPAGSWWFNVEPNSTYRAEIGFYAPNRPYFRAIYSNEITTPRKSPSPRIASEAEWRIPAEQFAKVLDVAGFKQDAFDVAITGGDPDRAAAASYEAIVQLTGRPEEEFASHDPDDIRYALMLLAAGATLEDLRFRVSDRLFALLQSVAERLSRETAVEALKAGFDIDEGDVIEEFEEIGPAVFGLSLVHFPRRKTTVRFTGRLDRIAPHSSHSLGR